MAMQWCNLSTCFEVHLCNRREINYVKTSTKSKEFSQILLKNWLQTFQYHPALLRNCQNPWKMSQHSQSQNMWKIDFLNIKQILQQPSATFSQDACIFMQRLRCHKVGSDCFHTLLEWTFMLVILFVSLNEADKGQLNKPRI